VLSLEIHGGYPWSFGRARCQSRHYSRLSQAECAFYLCGKPILDLLCSAASGPRGFGLFSPQNIGYAAIIFCVMKRIFIARCFALFSPFGSIYRREVAENLIFSAVTAFKRKFLDGLAQKSAF